MDIATPIGLIAGFALLAWAMLSGGELSTFIDIPSVIIVIGGTFSAVLVNYPLSSVLNLMRVVQNAFFGKESSMMATIDQLVELAEKARREGILSLEALLPSIEDQFLKNGLQHTIDGTEAETLKAILYSEVSQLEGRHGDGQKIVKSMSSLAPAFGMIGTLVGLVLMLKKLDDPSKIGVGMAVALITSLYGAVLANLVFIPLEGKLKFKTAGEVKRRELIIEGLLALQAGENPRLLRSRLQTFLAPKERKPVH